MAESQAEPFHIALATLHERLRAGAYRPGVRITAVDLADELRLSNTPG
jgi:DNA-binding GntR family transcriptional regulator